jgi:hypothetical protein
MENPSFDVSPGIIPEIISIRLKNCFEEKFNFNVAGFYLRRYL